MIVIINKSKSYLQSSRNDPMGYIPFSFSL